MKFPFLIAFLMFFCFDVHEALDMSTPVSMADIVYHCRNNECGFTNEDIEVFKSQQYKKKLYHLMSSGVPRVLWDTISDGQLTMNRINVSDSCQRSLLDVSQGLQAGRTWSYRCK